MNSFIETPESFEQEVRYHLHMAGMDLQNIEVKHREHVGGVDGEYEVDLTVRFRALGSEFLILVECKMHSHAIKRDYVQVLSDRIRSTGAHAGFLFATCPFQSGAVEYARIHGISLFQRVNGRFVNALDGKSEEKVIVMDCSRVIREMVEKRLEAWCSGQKK